MEVDADTRRYLKQLVQTYEKTILQLQNRVQELQSQLAAQKDPILRNIENANQKIERQIGQMQQTKHAQNIQMENERLRKRVSALEEQLKVEKELKYLWTEKPAAQDYAETKSIIREMRSRYG